MIGECMHANGSKAFREAMIAGELQLHPEQSTDAFVLHHPEAKYFST